MNLINRHIDRKRVRPSSTKKGMEKTGFSTTAAVTAKPIDTPMLLLLNEASTRRAMTGGGVVAGALPGSGISMCCTMAGTLREHQPQRDGAR